MPNVRIGVKGPLTISSKPRSVWLEYGLQKTRVWEATNLSDIAITKPSWGKPQAIAFPGIEDKIPDDIAEVSSSLRNICAGVDQLPLFPYNRG